MAQPGDGGDGLMHFHMSAMNSEAFKAMLERNPSALMDTMRRPEQKFEHVTVSPVAVHSPGLGDGAANLS